MHVKRIGQLAETIRNLPSADPFASEEPTVESFSMEAWQFECGSPSCIAGWTVELFGSEDQKRIAIHNGDMTFEVARNLLRIGQEDAEALFTPMPVAERETLCAKDAARCLIHFVETGKVDWLQAKYPPRP